MFKKLLVILLTPLVALGQTAVGPVRLNGPHVVVEAASGGNVSLQAGSSGAAVLSAGSATFKLNSSGYTLIDNIGTGLTAAGTTKDDALQLVDEINIIGTAAASTGVKLPVGVPGMRIYVYNGGANTVKIYPDAGGAINGGSADASINLATTKATILVCSAALTWYGFPSA